MTPLYELVAGVDRRVDTRKVDTVGATVSTLGATVSTFDERMPALDARLDRRLDALRGQLSEVLRQLGDR